MIQVKVSEINNSALGKKSLSFLKELLLLSFLIVPVDIISLMGVNILKGEFDFGDLTNFYNYGSIQPSYLNVISIYNLLEWALFKIIGNPLSQNLIFIFSFIVPSYGIYTMFRLVNQSKYKIALTSIIFGTLLDPFLHGEFVGGGYEYGLWMFFTFIAIGLSLRSIKYPNKSSFYLIGSGLFLGLANLSSQPMQSVGTILDFFIIPFIIIVILFNFKNQLKNKILTTMAFLLSFILTTLTLFLTLAQSYFSITKTKSTNSAAISYVLSNVKYVFKNISFLDAIGLSSTYWMGIIVILILVLFFVKDKFTKTEDKMFAVAGIFIIIISFFIYSVSASISNGNFYNIFIDIPILEKLDSPVFFYLLENIFIPLPFLGFLGILENINEKKIINPLNKSKNKLRKAKNLLKNGVNSRLIIIVLVILVMLIPVIIDEPNINKSLPLVQGYNYYTPNNMTFIHKWYESEDKNQTNGQVLLLPFQNRAWCQLYGLIPDNKIFNIPYLGNVLSNQYNVGIYSQIMQSLYDGKMTIFSDSLAFSSVQYIIILKYFFQTSSAKLPITPSYISGVYQENMNLCQLETNFNLTKNFKLTVENKDALIYQNLVFTSTNKNDTNIVQLNKSNLTNSVGTSILNLKSTLTNGSYLSPNLKIQSYSSFTLKYNQSSSFKNTIYWEGVNLSRYRNLLNISNRFTLRVTVKGDINIDNSDVLSVFFFGYNSSNPVSFYNNTCSSDLGSFRSNNHTFGRAFSIPNSIKCGRVIFQIFSKGSKLNGFANVSGFNIYIGEFEKSAGLNNSVMTNIVALNNSENSKENNISIIPSCSYINTSPNYKYIPRLIYYNAVLSTTNSGLFLNISRDYFSNFSSSNDKITLFIEGKNLVLLNKLNGLTYELISNKLIVMNVPKEVFSELDFNFSKNSIPSIYGVYLHNASVKLSIFNFTLAKGKLTIYKRGTNFEIVSQIYTKSKINYISVLINVTFPIMLIFIMILGFNDELRRKIVRSFEILIRTFFHNA